MSDELVEWRAGVRTLLHCGASTGGTQLCVIEQWCDPGQGAPLHTHHEVEEVLLFREGEAEVVLGDERRRVETGDAVRVPPHTWHSFENVGRGTLRVVGVFAAAAAPVEYAHEPGVVLEVGGVAAEMRDAHRAVRAAPPGASTASP